MESQDEIMLRIYNEQKLAMHIRDYYDTENDIVKEELYVKIRILMAELKYI